MNDNKQLIDLLQANLEENVRFLAEKDQLILEVEADRLREVCLILKETTELGFEMLIDICGIDYSDYGKDEWKKESATFTGFSRGVELRSHLEPIHYRPKGRFAVAYQLLSIKNNWRVQLKVYLEDDMTPMLDSVMDIWESANWYEREAFDLFGILFRGHPDLRRILTDYGFTGHPFRKDFPVTGHVEMRYDASMERCVYEPVGVIPRTLVPKVIREDHRYLITEEEGISHG